MNCWVINHDCKTIYQIVWYVYLLYPSFKILASFCSWAAWFESYLVENPRRHVFAWCGSYIVYITSAAVTRRFFCLERNALSSNLKTVIVTWQTLAIYDPFDRNYKSTMASYKLIFHSRSWYVIIWAISWQNQQNGMCAQRRLNPVWSESLLCAQWVAKDPRFLNADSEDSDQTGRIPRLIWVFAGRTVIFLVLSWDGSFVIFSGRLLQISWHVFSDSTDNCWYYVSSCTIP